MIDNTTEATTAEICALSDLRKQRLSQLEASGIIKRASKDRWPLVGTMRALFTDARARSAAHSEARARYKQARAQSIELRIKREVSELCWVSDFNEAITVFGGRIVAALVALPAQHHPQDLVQRRALEKRIDGLRTDIADWALAEASRLEEVARKSALRRA